MTRLAAFAAGLIEASKSEILAKQLHTQFVADAQECESKLCDLETEKEEAMKRAAAAKNASERKAAIEALIEALQKEDAITEHLAYAKRAEEYMFGEIQVSDK